MKYLVLEIQVNDNGQVGTLVTSCDTYATAESTFHQIVASAVISNLPRHTVMLLDEIGMMYELKTYIHTSEEPTE